MGTSAPHSNYLQRDLWDQLRSSSRVGPAPFHVIGRPASLRLGRGRLLRHQPRLGFLLRSSKRLSHLCKVPRLKDVWSETTSNIMGSDIFQLINDTFASSSSSYLSFFNVEDKRKDFENEGSPKMNWYSRRNSFNRGKWTNVILAINVLIYVAQLATQGELLLWGAKINSLIDEGEIWRLVTSSLLHANIGHLLVNCYSLYSIGPTVENISGSRRFLAVYFASAISSAATSYWFSDAPAVGASGAIFGLVGAFAVFVMRHRGMIRDGKDELQHIALVIFLNMVIGLMSEDIDNWGHLGGLLGGAVISWFLGPAWKYEPTASDDHKMFKDRAPLFYLIDRKQKPR